MDDLRVDPGPGAPRGLRVPAAELSEQFSHASGPGGQGVNTADSRVQLSLDLATTSALEHPGALGPVERLAHRTAGTVLTVTAAEQRSQRQNRRAARERLAALLREAVAPEVPRRATRPTKGSRRRRLEAKHRRSDLKQTRRTPRDL